MAIEEGHAIDAIWRTIKPCGRFQMFQVFLVIVDFIPCVFAILSAVFTGFIPEIVCTDGPEQSNSSLTDDSGLVTYDHINGDQCRYNTYVTYGNITTSTGQHACHNFNYSNTLSYSYEWNLVCSRSNLAALAQSLVLAGQGLGALTMSHISDRYGRKTVHVISHIGILVTMMLMAASQNIYMLLVLRLITGTFQQGMVCTGKVLSLETFPREIRSHMEAASFIAWSFGMMLLAGVAYLFKDIHWRYLQIALAACSLYALAEWWLLEESVRWNISNGRIEEAKKTIKKACRWNKVDFSKVEDLFKQSVRLEQKLEADVDMEVKNGALRGQDHVVHSQHKTKQQVEASDTSSSSSSSSKSKHTVEKYTLIDILKNPALRVNTFILWYTWIVATGTYYGLTLVSSHLAGDRFLNFLLSGVIEVPSLVLEFYLFNKIGRKKTLILWFAVAGISLIISTALLTAFKSIHAVYIVATAFSLIGKSASTGAFSTVFLYTPEIYPTNYRNSGLGIASAVSRIGGILAPFASNLALIALWIPGAIFGGMCLLVVLLALRLPESAKHELPNTIAECDKWRQTSNED